MDSPKERFEAHAGNGRARAGYRLPPGGTFSVMEVANLKAGLRRNGGGTKGSPLRVGKGRLARRYPREGRKPPW